MFPKTHIAFQGKTDPKQSVPRQTLKVRFLCCSVNRPISTIVLDAMYMRSVQCSSVSHSCPTIWNPMNCSTPGLPVHHQLLEFTQTHVHWAGDAIQTSQPLSSLILLPLIPPRIRVFFNESTLCIRWPKYWSFSFNISPSNEHPEWSPLGLTGWISLQSKGLSRVFSNTTVQKHQFFGAHLSWQSNSHIHTWPLEKP